MEETPDTPALSDESRAKLSEALATIQDATFDVLLKKPTREVTFFVHVANDDGTARPVRLRYKAIAPAELDDLITAHPPSSKAARDGATWSKDTFPPALIAAVSLAPRLTEEQARELYTSPNWSEGERQTLFNNAWMVCNAGLDVPFNAGD